MPKGESELDRVSLELRQMAKELEFRTTVTTAMLSTLDLDQILYVILSGITSGDGLGFNRAFLFLDQPQGRSLRVVMALGPPGEEEAQQIWSGIRRKRITLSELLPAYETYRSDPGSKELTLRLANFSLPFQRLESLAAAPHQLLIGEEAPLAAVLARCLVSESPFASNALSLYHEVGGPGGEVMRFRFLAIVPLLVGGKLIGAILADNLYSESSVGSEDLKRLHALGNLASLSIDRARLHGKAVGMAEVDGLTGVYNRRFYEQELKRAISACHHGGQSLTIVVFDLDFFKDTNDQHGHLVGDEVLKDVARLLANSVRKSDKVARYGGEEFVLLLPHTTASQGEKVAEKLRNLVRSTPLARGKVRGLTLSAGVASTRGEDSPESLFERADRAMYQAKADGRDRVVVLRK